jgi:hypothetical protein
MTMKVFYTTLIIAVCLFSSTKIKSATFESKASGNWQTAATWTITSGSDSDGKPDLDDDVIIKTGHIVKLPTTGSSSALTLNVNAGGTLNGISKVLTVYGNLTQSGSITALYLQFAATATLSTPSSTYAATGYIRVLSNRTLTIASGSVVKMAGFFLLDQTGSKVINQGTVILSTVSSSIGTLKLSGTNSNWTNDGASSVSIIAPAVISASASMSVTGVGSTFNYNNTSTIMIPGQYYNLNISTANTKTLSGDVEVINNLLLSTAGSSILNLNGKKLILGGGATLNSPVTGTVVGSTVVFNGSSGATQSIVGTRSITTQFMEINTPTGGVFFNTTQQNRVLNTLTLIDGDFDANGKLTLVSNASTTARIAPVTGGSFTGSIIMEKFFAADNAKWFDLSSPAANSTVNDWDNEMYIAGIGSYDGIGGPAGVDGDVYSTSNPFFNYTKSMHTYDEPTAAYVGVSGSATALTPGIGYDMWFEDEVNDQWKAKTINTIGIPNTGDVTLSLSNTGVNGIYDGYHLIGNPYASVIDLSLIYDFSGLYDSNMDYFDISVLDGTATGNFSPIDAITPINPLIYPHQGFWVKALAGGGTFTFHEGCKVSDVTTAVNQRKAANYDIKLMLTSASTNFYHENFVNFNSLATVNFDRQYDSPFRYSPIKEAPALFMQDGSGKMMTKNSINSTADEVAIPLGLYTPQTAVYYVEASVLNMDSYNYAWIENVKTGKQIDLNSNSVAIEGQEGKTNTDYVLHLSKTKKPSAIASTILESDLVIFNTENTINLKSNVSSHNLSEVTVYDMTGKLVLSQTNINVELGNVTKIDVSNLSNGVYVVNAIDVNGKSISKKLVK